ncbi:MAG: DUF4350 domain-containing protein [Dysgonamonadaceae bacterium]|jgi:hypothetical protein|nr:DUF4350 domain-containing protein [Dysgonamonadaceae bacterium]
MKKYIPYMLFLVTLFAVMYWLNSSRPVKYQWEPTYKTSDRQPYGDYVLDKLLKASWQEGYEHSYEGILDLAWEETIDNYNLLIIADNFDTEEEEADSLFRFIERGGNALIIANYWWDMEDSLQFHTTTDYSGSLQSIVNLDPKEALDSLRLCARGTSREIYAFPKAICNQYFTFNDNSTPKIPASIFRLSETMDDRIISLRVKIGKGNLILSCNPLLYTNYGVLNEANQNYILQHLAYLKGRPLLRTEYYQVGSQGGAENQSIFRYILSEPPLRWAFYLTLLSVALFMIFTAKRKQKPIPVIRPPVNNMVAFVRSIAGLYLQRNNNTDVIRKKYIYWSDELKRKYGVDVINEKHDKHLIARLASKTRKTEEEIRRVLAELDAIHDDTEVSDEEMIELITKMNEIQ